jgi:hypothetical protein
VPILGSFVPVKLFFLGIFFANQTIPSINLLKTPYFTDIMQIKNNLFKKKYFSYFYGITGFFEKNVIIL